MGWSVDEKEVLEGMTMKILTVGFLGILSS